MNKTSFSPLARDLACRFRLARLDLAPTIEVLVRSSGFFAPLVSRARAAGWKASGEIATQGGGRAAPARDDEHWHVVLGAEKHVRMDDGRDRC